MILAQTIFKMLAAGKAKTNIRIFVNSAYNYNNL